MTVYEDIRNQIKFVNNIQRNIGSQERIAFEESPDGICSLCVKSDKNMTSLTLLQTDNINYVRDTMKTLVAAFVSMVHRRENE